jgi:3-phenylpropionate/trans-cinnamate dioxygenase ferredoxin reductase subunit
MAKPYNPVPWFWSDQYELKLQMVGLSQGYDATVLRGVREKNSFAVFYVREGTIIATDTVNRPQEFMLAKQLVARGARVDAARLADDSKPLKELLAA